MLLNFLDLEKKLTFLYSIHLNLTPIATSILCLNTLFKQYTLALLLFLNHGTYYYNIIQLKYQTVVLLRILFKHILYKTFIVHTSKSIKLVYIYPYGLHSYFPIRLWYHRSTKIIIILHYLNYTKLLSYTT